MYYVIQRHHGNPKKHYIAYSVPKYITSAASKNIIFEFHQEGSVKRKWAPKQEIVLLTDDAARFQSTLSTLEALQKIHSDRIDAAEAQLHHAMSEMVEAMQGAFENIKHDD